MTFDVGPVEYMVIDIPGNRFNGEIIPAITDLDRQRRHRGQPQGAQ